MPATIPLLQEGRYSIEQEFPAAENCSVFQAYDTEDESAVTIVEVPIRLPKVATAAQRETLQASFDSQAKALTAFRHKSIPTVRGFFTEAGRSYVVTDPVDGTDLADVLEDQNGPCSLADVTAWADTLLDSLNGLHMFRPPLVYRNVSPANIMLRTDGTVSFSPAAMVVCGEQSGLSGRSSSIAYSPLEQIWSGLDAASQKVIISKYDEASERILKQDLDARSDLYALGATLYHLLTGNPPIDALERSIEMIEGNADPLIAPSKLNTSIPTEVSDVVMKAMEIKREYRFDSAAIMRQVLKTALVRVKEREAEEAQSPAAAVEAAAIPAMQAATAQPAAKSVDDADEVMRKLREAEEKRLEAERRAIEAEEKLKATEAAAPAARPTGTFNLSDLEDDLLGLMDPSAHTSEPPQSRNGFKPEAISAKPEVEQAEETLAAVVQAEEAKEVEVTEEFETAEEFAKEHPETEAPLLETAESPEVSDEPAAETEAANEELNHSEAPSEPEPIVGQTVVAAEPEKAEEKAAVPQPLAAAATASAYTVSTTDDLFAARKSGSGMGIPAIAAAAVVLCVVAIGAWFFLGSKSDQPAATTSESPAAAQQQEEPVKTAFQPSEPAAPAQGDPSTQPVTADDPAADQPQKVASAAPQKPKKNAPAAAKTPAPKKAVTVDDLINDN